LLKTLSFAAALAAFPLAAIAQTPPPPGQNATVTGTVRSQAGAPIAGALVVISGPASMRTRTDANGAFSFSLAPGIYRIDVTQGGYLPAVLRDLVLVQGENVPLSIALTAASLTQLRTIAQVSVTRGSSINTGTASIEYLPSQAITNLANPQINDVLQQLPETTIQHMGSQPDTTIILGGAQPYETQVLIDGHPISMGQFGVWLTEYFSSFLLAGVETQVGPGNTTPFANTAVGGTANLITPSFSNKPQFQFVTGIDSFNSQYSNLLASDSFGRLSWVLGAGYGSSNGPYFKGFHCVVLPNNTLQDNSPASNGIIQFCDDSSGSLFTKGEILKLRYDFSSATSFEAGFIGSQGGYLPQGISYGQYLGTTLVDACLPSQPLFCNDPKYSGLIGQRIPAYAWYPGSDVFSNQPIFTGQFRTSIGNDTLLIRPYAGNIERIIAGQAEQYYPYTWGPPGATSGTTRTNFETACNNNNFLSYIPTTPVFSGGQELCLQDPFSEFEQDKLYGTTLSYLHPFGDNLITFNYDFHGDRTFAYYNAPSQIATPNTLERYTTISLTGDLKIIQNLSMRVGLYDTIWKLAGLQPGTPVAGVVPLLPLTRTVDRFDPHLALVYQPHGSVSYRLAWGTSETYPFSGQVSGLPENTPPSATFPGGFITEKNPLLNPEVATEFSGGADYRVPNGATLSIDLQDTTIHNVFETLTIPNFFSTGQALVKPFNAALLHAELASIRYNYAPPIGLGYYVSFALERSIAYGIPSTFYPTLSSGNSALPVNGVQICGEGEGTPGTITCIPYMKGYGQVSYQFADGAYTDLGLEFEGKNNAYFQPPFVQLDFTYRHPITGWLDAQFAVQNLLNNNAYQYIPQPDSGTPITSGQVNGAGMLVQSSLPSALVPAPPRTARFELRWHQPPSSSP
jgi:hypothetical protein